MPADRSHSQKSAKPKLKTYTVKRFKHADLLKPYVPLYEQHYVEEFKKEPTKVPKDPRGPRLKLSNLEYIRTMGINREEVILANVIPHRYNRFNDGPFPVALKSYIRSRMRGEMFDFIQNDTATETAKKNKAYTYGAKHLRIHEEKMNLVNMPWSPWVAGLYQTFHDEERIYMALEYIPGNTLRNLMLKQRGGFPLETACFYYTNIVLALEFLAKHNIVHCDLKPENLLIGGDGYLVLTDFGSASQSTDPHPSDFVDEGTFFYRAPETLVLYEINFSGEYFEQDLDSTTNPHASDWWSSGIILFELVTGKVPFDHSDADAQRVLLHKAVYKWPAGFRAGKRLQDLVSRLLERQPTQRLGAPNVLPLKCHSWFSTVDWDQMALRHYSAPFVPKERNMANIWATMPTPKQEYIPGLKIAEQPMHVQHDNRFFKRPIWEIRRNYKNQTA